MKALRFLGNRVEDAANAFIDALKYSDQSVDYPDFKDIEPWPEDIVNMFKDALKDKPFSEISALKIAWNSEIEPIGNYKKDLILIFKLKAKGLYYKDIAKRLGVSVGTIGRVINKKSYRDENIDRKR